MRHQRDLVELGGRAQLDLRRTGGKGEVEKGRTGKRDDVGVRTDSKRELHSPLKKERTSVIARVAKMRMCAAKKANMI
jgi:hypothetical protein